MKTRFPILIPGLLLALFVFSACKKDNNEPDPFPSPDAKLVKVSTKHGDSLSVTYYSYENDGRLKKVEQEHHGEIYFRTWYHYDAAGKIEKTIFESVLSPSSPTWTTTYTYTNNRITTSIGNITYAVRTQYIYDAQGRLIRDSVYMPSTNHATAYHTYTYDANDNLVEWDSFTNWSGGWQSHGKFRASHNTALNPLGDARFIYGITGASGGPSTESSTYSKNLVTQIIHPNGAVVNYHYELYSNGYPKKAITSGNWGTAVTEFVYQ